MEINKFISFIHLARKTFEKKIFCIISYPRVLYYSRLYQTVLWEYNKLHQCVPQNNQVLCPSDGRNKITNAAFISAMLILNKLGLFGFCDKVGDTFLNFIMYLFHFVSFRGGRAKEGLACQLIAIHYLLQSSDSSIFFAFYHSNIVNYF